MSSVPCHRQQRRDTRLDQQWGLGLGFGPHARFSVSGDTVTAGFMPTGLGMDVEFPRVELSIFGILTTFASVLAHVSGYFTPGTTLSNKIPPCQKAKGDVAGYAGVTLSIFGLAKIALGSKQLFQSQPWEVHKAGTCGG